LLGRAGRDVHIRDISMGGLAFPYHWPIASGVPVAICVPNLVGHIEAYRQQVLELEGRSISSDEAAAEWISVHAAHFPRCRLWLVNDSPALFADHHQ